MNCINKSSNGRCHSSHGRNHSSSSNNCVAEVVRFINDLQNAVVEPCCLTNCLNPVLGERLEALQANTRPFILFGEDGNPFTAYFRKKQRCESFDDFKLCPSFVFRVECVEGDCAILRVLKMEKDRHEHEMEYDSDDCSPRFCLELTDSCITCNLNCFCAIQCLEDVRLG